MGHAVQRVWYLLDHGCLMCGRIPTDEDAWLWKKWKTEVNMDSLQEGGFPPFLVENKDDAYKAFTLAGMMCVFSNEAPLSDTGTLEEGLVGLVTLPKGAELSNAGTPEQDMVVPVNPSKVA